MRRYLLYAALGLMAAPAVAQETYQDTKMAENSLTGTARYIGMGGAMEALGAEISTISTNPAGIGLFRSSQVSLSAGVVTQSGGSTYMDDGKWNLRLNDASKTKASFDQIGVVWSPNKGKDSYINLAFNYHKSTNFNQILNATGSLAQASQNRLTAAKMSYMVNNGWSMNDMKYVWTGVDKGYESMFNYSPITSIQSAAYNTLSGDSYLYGQYQRGYIGEYSFNISGAIKNRVWLGVTFGLHDVHYQSNSSYGEALAGNAAVQNNEQIKITGTGFDVKFGAIVRPVESSPFRIGAYVNTPVFYSLTMRSALDMDAIGLPTSFAPSDASIGTDGLYSPSYTATCDYDYRLNTPWKVGVSLGHTVGGKLALGATYEYAWYNYMDNRIKNGGYYDYYYDTYYETSSSDKFMNDHTRSTLQGVSTVKLGLEYKPISMLAIRVGYNYVSPMFKENGYRDQMVGSPGTCYATSTDYTNWKATNRVTAGVGFNYKQLFIDLAYQYSTQKGDFYPFMSYYKSDTTNAADQDNVASASPVKFDRHQVLMTVGYKF